MLRRSLPGRLAHLFIALVFALTLVQGAATAGRAAAGPGQGGGLAISQLTDALGPILQAGAKSVESPSARSQPGQKRTPWGGRDGGSDPLPTVLLAFAAALLLPGLRRARSAAPATAGPIRPVRPHRDGRCPTGPPQPVPA